MDIVLARTYVMLIMVFMENIHIFNCRSEKTSIFKIRMKDNLFVIITLTIANIIQILIIRNQSLANIFELTCIPAFDAIGLLILTIPLIIVMEMFKKIINKTM